MMLQPRWRRRRPTRLERDAPGLRRQRWRRLWPRPGRPVSPGRERSGDSPPAGLARITKRQPRREEAVRTAERERRLLPRHHGWAHQETDPEAPLQVSKSLGCVWGGGGWGGGAAQSASDLAGTGVRLQPRGRRGLAAVGEASLELPDPAWPGSRPRSPVVCGVRRRPLRSAPLDGFSFARLADEPGGLRGEAAL